MDKMKYFKNLDGLRALAALGVLIAHFFDAERLLHLPSLVKITQIGNSGVSLFFVLSGFVITRILLNTVNEKRYFINFYGRRTLRIFPLYYFSLLCYNFAPLLLNIVTSIDVSKQWYHYLYLQNFARTFLWDHEGPGHFWSLAVEEHFYLIWPGLVFLANTKNKNRLLFFSVLILFIAFILRYIMLSDGYNINVFTFTRIDQLALGCILAILENKGILDKMKPKVFLFIMAISVVFVAFSSKLGIFYLDLVKYNAYGFLYFGLIGYCIVSKPNVLFNRFLTFAPVQFLGKISYGLYIWHVLVMLLLEHYVKSFGMMIDFSVMVVFTIILSSLSYYLLESKFLLLKKYFK
jgi:peptidoglycan/LPS O-acetylase OafA/YrhL